MNLDNCHAVITGASAGIGREFARQLAGRARSLVLIARREKRLHDLRDELTKRKPHLEVDCRVVDLADKSQVNQLAAWLSDNKTETNLLINNAGLGDMGAFATGDPERDDRIIQVNITALTLLTRSLLPGMIARKSGRILNVSSSAGFLPIPGFAVYAASKAYVNSLSEALRIELHGTGVSVTALCPGPVHTEFQEVAKRPNREPEHGPEFVQVSVEKVVEQTLAAIENDRPLLIPGVFMKIGMGLIRTIPMPLLRLASRYSNRRL